MHPFSTPSKKGRNGLRCLIGSEYASARRKFNVQKTFKRIPWQLPNVCVCSVYMLCPEGIS